MLKQVKILSKSFPNFISPKQVSIHLTPLYTSIPRLRFIPIALQNKSSKCATESFPSVPFPLPLPSCSLQFDTGVNCIHSSLKPSSLAAAFSPRREPNILTLRSRIIQISDDEIKLN